MGGYGSGRYYGARDTTGAYRQIDVRFLQSKGALRAGTESEIWWNKDTPRSASVGLRAESNRIILDYKQRRPGHEWKDEEYAVSIEWTLATSEDSAPGSAVRWPGAVAAFASCTEEPSSLVAIATASPTRVSTSRPLIALHRAVTPLGRAWGAWGTFFDPLPPRPKGMHSQTYRRLQMQYARHHHASLMDFSRKFGMLPEEALELA